MSHNVCSEILEKLIQDVPKNILILFLRRLQGQYWHLAQKRFASHVLQTWISACARFVSEEQDEMKRNGFIEDKNQVSLVHCVSDFAVELKDNLQDGIKDIYCSHVLRSLFILLSGKISLNDNFVRSTSSKQFKAHNKLNDARILKDFDVPEQFSLILKSLSDKILENTSVFADLIFDPNASPTLQVFYMCCKQSEREYMFKKLFSDKNKQEKINFTVSIAQEKIGSHFLQVALKYLSPASLRKYYEICLKVNFSFLIQNECSQYVMKDLIISVKEKELFEDLLDELIPIGKQLLQWNRIAILVAVANKCVELGKCFKKTINLINSIFDFNETANIQKALDPKMQLNTSLILQSVFKFQSKYTSPFVEVILNFPREQLILLLTSPTSSRVIEAFFEGPSPIEQKKQFVMIFRGVYHKLSIDKYASHLVQKIWSLFSIDVKKMIATELASHRKIMQDSQYGSILLREFRIEKFSYRPDEWEKELKTVDKKRKMIEGFLSEE